MASAARMAEVAALAGDPSRVAMLHALMDGRALPAGALADAAGIAPPTASGHLARLAVAGLVVCERRGRHRLHRLAGPEVARMVETIMQVASLLDGRGNAPSSQRDAALRAARTCYDHLAGRLGVAMADALVACDRLVLGDDGGLVTARGMEFFRRRGVDIAGLGARSDKRRNRRLLCRPCLDWSERRPHLAGALGAALCRTAFDRGWVRRLDGTRAVAVTPRGQQVFRDEFGVRPA